MNVRKGLIQIVIGVLLLASIFSVNARDSSPQSAPKIEVNGYFTHDKVKRGRIAQATVVMDIPSGFHVNSNKPLEKFLIATQLQIEAPGGVRVGSVVYPRPVFRNLKFSKNRVSVYEGRATMRFNVTVPASFGSDSLELKARLRYQSCSDEFCFPPQTREVKIPVTVVSK
jgi:DsbC/DsbD-like thiol-disulfide interchange protein